jgi:HEAT repeat protein
MSQRAHRSFLPLFAVLFVSMCFAEEPAKKLSEKQIAKLIEQLGSSDFHIRESANRQLRQAEEALPALRQAAQSSDLEVRRRAKEIVAALEQRLSERFLRQAVARVNEEGVDLFIDRMVLQKDYANETRWKAVIEVARTLSKCEPTVHR